MKAIQVMFDERLVQRLDREYLRRSRDRRIAESYRRAYAVDGGLGAEFAGWEDEGAWPPDSSRGARAARAPADL